MRRLSRKVWIEFFIVIGVLGVLFAFTFPKFLDAQTINDSDHFPDPAFRASVETFMGVRQGEPFSATKAARRAGTLRCGEETSDLTGIEYFKSMSAIQISRAKVTRADFSKNPSLISIHLDNTPISTLDISKNIKLKDLFCRGLKIAALDVSNNPYLTKLDCRANGFTSIDISACINLRQFLCMDNAFTQLDLSHNPHLRHLSCYNNQLRALDLSKNVELNKLYCDDNQLTQLDLSNNPYLEALHCKNNAIQEILLCETPKLTSVDCGNNCLKSIQTFVGVKTLYYLNVCDNELGVDDAGDVAVLKEWFSGENLMMKIPVGINVRTGFVHLPQKSDDL